jgi:hypothetical protein
MRAAAAVSASIGRTMPPATAVRHQHATAGERQRQADAPPDVAAGDGTRLVALGLHRLGVHGQQPGDRRPQRLEPGFRLRLVEVALEPIVDCGHDLIFPRLGEIAGRDLQGRREPAVLRCDPSGVRRLVQPPRRVQALEAQLHLLRGLDRQVVVGQDPFGHAPHVAEPPRAPRAEPGERRHHPEQGSQQSDP